MNKSKIAISVDHSLLEKLDSLVKNSLFPNRSKAIEDAIKDKIARIEGSRLAIECSKLSKRDEMILADEGIAEDFTEWPEY